MNSLWFLQPLLGPAPLCSESEKQLLKLAVCWANTGVAEAPITSAAAIEMVVKRMVISSSLRNKDKGHYHCSDAFILDQRSGQRGWVIVRNYCTYVQ